MTEPQVELTDAELIAQVQLGTEEEGLAAFEALYERYACKLLHHLSLATRSYGLATEEREEIADETWLRAWRTIDRFKDVGASFLTWLKGIAHYVTLEYWRDRYLGGPLEDHQEVSIPEANEPPQQVVIRLTVEDAMVAVTDLLKEAPDDYRTIIEASFLSELSTEEIMEMCEWSRELVYTKKSRALAWLRQRLRKRHGTSVIADWLDATLDR